MSSKIPEPWLSFLNEIDAFVYEETYLHCLGGFVVTVVYGRERETSDIDVLTLVRRPPGLFEKAGLGSEMYKRSGLYLDPVGVATLPENYEDRLGEVFPGTFKSSTFRPRPVRFSPRQDRMKRRHRPLGRCIPRQSCAL